jgi:hypothetical protein
MLRDVGTICSRGAIVYGSWAQAIYVNKNINHETFAILRNNSMGQCQLVLENNEENNLKIPYLLNIKKSSFDLVYFKY